MFNWCSIFRKRKPRVTWDEDSLARDAEVIRNWRKSLPDMSLKHRLNAFDRAVYEARNRLSMAQEDLSDFVEEQYAALGLGIDPDTTLRQRINILIRVGVDPRLFRHYQALINAYNDRLERILDARQAFYCSRDMLPPPRE